ncbi:MAG: DUF3267 domain-containing protein [Ignavibacteriae bacterium]|nr:DUF3267 domain-containing protein [Ignavibacteriota bacterium]
MNPKPSDPPAAGDAAAGSVPYADYVPVSDATLSLARANVVAIALLPAMTVAFLAPTALLYGWDALGAGFRAAIHPWLFIHVLLVAIVVHELLHAVGYRYVGGVPRAAIRFGMNWKALAPYAHCAAPMTARAYALSAALPLIVLGIVPNLAGLLTGAGWLVFWSFFLSIAASGDIAILWAIRAVPATAIVRDHPSRAGCEVLAPGPDVGIMAHTGE